MAAPVTLKIKYQDTVHRVPLREAQLNFESVMEVIQEYHPGSVTATYLDEEGDQCTLCPATFGDFAVGAGRCADGGVVLRLEPAPKSAWSEQAKLAAGSPRAAIRARGKRMSLIKGEGRCKGKGMGKWFGQDAARMGIGEPTEGEVSGDGERCDERNLGSPTAKGNCMWPIKGKGKRARPSRAGGTPDLEHEDHRFAAEGGLHGDDSAGLGTAACSWRKGHERKGKSKGKGKSEGKGKWSSQESAQSWIYERTDGEVAGGGELCDDNDLGSLRAIVQADRNCIWHVNGKGKRLGKGEGKGAWPGKDGSAHRGLEHGAHRFPWQTAEDGLAGDDAVEPGVSAGSCLTTHEAKGHAMGKFKGKGMGKWFGQDSAQMGTSEPTEGEVSGDGERCDERNLGSPTAKGKRMWLIKGRGKWFGKGKGEGKWAWPGRAGGAPDLEHEDHRFPWQAAEGGLHGDDSAGLGTAACSWLKGHERKGKAKGKGKGKWSSQESAQSWAGEPTDGEVAGGGEHREGHDLGERRFLGPCAAPEAAPAAQELAEEPEVPVGAVVDEESEAATGPRDDPPLPVLLGEGPGEDDDWKVVGGP